MSLNLRHKSLAFVMPVICCVFLACVVTSPKIAVADSSLSVYVGYTGGPYYLKTKFTEAEIKAMSDDKTYEYATFDAGKFLVKGAGRGVDIATIFAKAGIDTSNLKRFYFATSDGYVKDDGGEGNQAWYYSELTQTRYYYPKLGEYWDFKDKSLKEPEGVDINQVMSSTKVSTKTILAFQSSFFRPQSAQQFASIGELKQYEGLRLMMGQSNFTTGNAFYFSQSVKAITCIFGSNASAQTPEISMEVNGQTGGTFEANVGDVIKINPSIKADDALISKYGIYDIRWTISDPSIADFVRDNNGNVVIGDDGTVSVVVYGKGDITVSASFGDSPFPEYVAHSSLSGKGTGEGGGSGSGKGQGVGDGEGEGEGNGAGNLDGEQGTPVTFDSKAELAEAQDSSLGAGGGGGEQATVAAFKLNVKDAQTVQEQQLDEDIQQVLMLDFRTYGAALLFLLFACVTFGIVYRVKKTESEKDPFMNLKKGS